MIHRGVARHVVVAALFVALVTATLAVHVAARARGAEASRCERFAAASVLRGQAVTGAGAQVVVVGDSYSAGLGLDDPATRGRPGSRAGSTSPASPAPASAGREPLR